ncbi:MAG: flagellar basal body L-ring protein FlgH [Woeseiaceae bacterium]
MKNERLSGCKFLLPMFCFMTTGCTIHHAHEESFEPPTQVPMVQADSTSGSIYQNGTEVRLFEDLKAGRVGDILTVRLIERTTASKNSATATTKASDVTLANPTVFGRPITLDGVPLFEGSLNGDSEFEGTGQSSQSNSLVGDITVTVVERFPNGNLRIRGEKWVHLNQGKEFIRLSGIIRPFDIETSNSIPSNKIADAQITYSSKGVMAAANRQGIISRFFNSILHPY